MPGPILLAVDDTPDNLFLVQQIVAEYLPDCSVLTARSADEAWSLLAKGAQVDGALADVQMPGTDGATFCRQLKASAATRRIPVILITAKHSTPKLRAEGLDAGADDFISRPIDNVELTAKIRVMLRIRQAERALGVVRDELEERVESRTADLAATNRRLQQEIRDRERAETLLRQSSRELRVRNRIADAFLLLHGDEVYGEVLQVVLDTLESRHGVFGYIDEEGTLVCPSFTREVWNQCEMSDKTARFPRESWGQGIWGRALRTRRSYYSNEPFTVPGGHIPMERAMSVPIVYQGDAIGLINIANKAADYTDEDESLMRRIADSIAPILHARLQRDRHEARRRTAEDALRRAHGDLERRVEERTAQLSEANQRLQREIIERGEAEARARQHEAELAHVSRLSTIGEMGSAIAHELSQPLCAILTSAQAALRMMKAAANDPAAIRQAIEQVVAQAKRSGEIIRHMKDFSRKREPHRSTIHMNDLVRDAVGFVAAEARPRHVRIDVSLAEGLPALLGDTIQIEQVIVNLLRNAIEALEEMPADRRHLRIESRLGEAGQIALMVADSGKGLTEESAARIFEPFFSTKTQGMGIGLAISRSIIEAHGGRLWADPPAEHAGAVFRFALPAHETEAAPAG